MSKIRCLGCMEEYDDKESVCPYCGYKKGTPVKELYHLIPGTVLNNRYLVGQSVGFGGFGITYIGWDKTLNKKVAIKEYLPSEFATRMEGTTCVTAYDGEKTQQFEAGLSRFVDEALRLAKLNHLDGIVHIYDSFVENNTAYIVMEYLKGDTLKSILKQRHTLSYQEAIDIALPLLKSLDEVHQKGIIHRDIAPDNIIITDDGRVKLIDFGAARYATTVHSKSLSVVLKPGYAPEEQYRSHGNQGPWSDVYAMGATLYRAITGVVPEDSLERKSNDELEDISKFVPDIPKPLENAIMNALNVNAADRIQTAKEFADALSGVSELERNKVKQRQADAGKWSLKMKILAISAIVVCVAVIGVLVLNTTSIHNNEKFKADTIQLYGKTIAQAEKELKANNITLKVTDNNYDDELVGKLDENTIVSPNDVNVKAKAVSVVVFAGKRGNANADKYGNVQVPNLYGMKESKAKDLLNKYGLKYNRVLVENNSFVGNVFKQSLKANSKVKVGTKITITVGKKKVVHTTVPTTTSYSVPETENNDSYNNNSDNSNNNSYNNANNNANNNSNYNSNQQTPKNNVQSTKSAAKSNDSKLDDSNAVDVGGFLD